MHEVKKKQNLDLVPGNIDLVARTRDGFTLDENGDRTPS